MSLLSARSISTHGVILPILAFQVILMCLPSDGAAAESVISPFLRNFGTSFSTVFEMNDEVGLHLEIVGCHAFGGNLGTVTIRNFWGKNVITESVEIKRPSKEKAFIVLRGLRPLLTSGWYSVGLTVNIKTGRAVPIESDISFVILPQKSLKKRKGIIGVADLWGYMGATIPLNFEVAEILKRLRIGHIRFFAAFEGPEGPHRLQRIETQFRHIIEICTQVGIEPLPVLLYPEGEDRAIPPSRDQWQRFVDRLAGLYGRKIPYWEIWNEPNVKGFWAESVSDYRQYVRIARNELTASSKNIHIVLGGLSGTDDSWIQRFSKNGGDKLIDIVGVHTYRFSEAIPEKSTANTKLHYGGRCLGDDLQILKQSMPGKPIWITETGLNTMPISEERKLFGPVSIQEQAARMVRHVLIAKEKGVSRIYWWMFADTFGLGTGLFSNTPAGLMPKPIVVALSILNQIIGQKTDVQLSQSNGIYTAGLFDNGHVTWKVYWCISGKEMITVPTDADLIYMDLMGTEHKSLSKNKKASIKIGPHPVFIPNQAIPRGRSTS